MENKLEIKKQGVPFRNHAQYCVGTGRIGLALQKEYQEHLELVQNTIRFQYIRGHGLFCRDVFLPHRLCRSVPEPRPFFLFCPCRTSYQESL